MTCGDASSLSVPCLYACTYADLPSVQTGYVKYHAVVNNKVNRIPGCNWHVTSRAGHSNLPTGRRGPFCNTKLDFGIGKVRNEEHDECYVHTTAFWCESVSHSCSAGMRTIFLGPFSGEWFRTVNGGRPELTVRKPSHFCFHLHPRSPQATYFGSSTL